jgi:hypothetical protein
MQIRVEKNDFVDVDALSMMPTCAGAGRALRDWPVHPAGRVGGVLVQHPLLSLHRLQGDHQLPDSRGRAGDHEQHSYHEQRQVQRPEQSRC